MKNLFLVFVFFLCVLVSCNTNPTNFDNGKSADKHLMQFSREDEILLYSLSGNCKIDDKDVASDLSVLLDMNLKKSIFDLSNVKIGENEQNSSNVMYKKTYTFKNNNSICNTLLADNGEVLGDTINVYILEINNKNGKKFAVVSDDMRVGSVLCVLDKEIDDSFIQEIIDPYVENIKKENDSIDEKTVERFKVKYNISDEDIRRAIERNENLTSKMFGSEYTPWVLNRVNMNNRIKTFWGKEQPYTEAIEAVYGFSPKLGDVELMLAQILAFYRPNYKCSQRTLSKINEKWDKAKNYNAGKGWDGVYNWDAMTKGKSYSECSELGQICIGALFLELSKVNLIEKKFYPQRGTKGVEKLRQIGFEHNWIWASFSFNDVSKSIDRARPVFSWLYYGVDSPMYEGKNVRWNGHNSWIIDGYKQFKRQKTFYFFWIPFRSTQYDNFVYCNFGDQESNDSAIKADLFKQSYGHFKNYVSAVTDLHLVK